MTRLHLQRDQPAAGGQRARKPDRAIAAERTDFQNAPGTLQLRKDHEELALRRRHIDRRQSRLFACLERVVQRRILQLQEVSSVVIDLVPEFGRRERAPLVHDAESALTLCNGASAQIDSTRPGGMYESPGFDDGAGL